MACFCRRTTGPESPVDDSEIAEAYGSAFENERNILYHPDYDDERENIEDDGLSSDENISRDMIFVDGNDGDLEACQYEDTLMERVWRSSKPPKIPKQSCVVPARRIQIMKERLSPTVSGLPTLRQPLTDQENKTTINKRHRIKSDVKYVPVNNFDNGKHFSCQSKNTTILPNCARKLEDF